MWLQCASINYVMWLQCASINYVMWLQCASVNYVMWLQRVTVNIYLGFSNHSSMCISINQTIRISIIIFRIISVFSNVRVSHFDNSYCKLKLVICIHYTGCSLGKFLILTEL